VIKDIAECFDAFVIFSFAATDCDLALWLIRSLIKTRVVVDVERTRIEVRRQTCYSREGNGIINR
jgi:hypothetical protein